MNTITTQEQTRIVQRRGEWTGETRVIKAGQAYLVISMKGRGGINSRAIAVNDEGGGSLSFFGFDTRTIQLPHYPATRVTESVMREAHYKALCDIDSRVEAGEVVAPVLPQVGQLFFTHGYANEYPRVVVEVLERGRYKCALLDGSGFKIDQFVKPWAQKFGIGVYFKDGDTVSLDEVAELVSKCQAAEIARAEAQKSARILADAERAAKLEEGAKIVHTLPNCPAIIVADIMIDESEPMTDYFHERTGERVYLAISQTGRNSFPELRKAAGLWDKSAHLVDQGEENRRDFALREKYRGGVRVSKIEMPTLECLQIAAAEGRYLVKSEERAESFSVEGLEIVDYSDKAVAIFGDTKPVKDHLKAIGARFNPYLNRDGQKCAGWILPKSKQHLINNN